MKSTTSPAKLLVLKARFVVVDKLYYEMPNTEPIVVDSGFARWLETDEQPYIRRFTVGEQWQAVNTGWLEETSMLLIENNEERFTVNPTSEEKTEAAQKVIEIAFPAGKEWTEASWLILPGESLRGTPANIKNLWLRCRKGKAKCTITLIPE